MTIPVVGQTISTEEELDALPPKSVVLDANNDVWQNRDSKFLRYRDRKWRTAKLGADVWTRGSSGSVVRGFGYYELAPFTVLYVGEVTE